MVIVVGTSKILAALARPTTLFFMVWRSIDCTPKAICGWWSMMISWLLRGVRTCSLALLAFDMVVSPVKKYSISLRFLGQRAVRFVALLRCPCAEL